MIPATAFKWQESMDPADVVDFTFDVAGMLDEGEAAATVTLELGSEAETAGLQLGSGASAFALVSGTTYRLWLSVDADSQNHPRFGGQGVWLPLELTVVTDSVPPRTHQRTLLVKVVHQ